MPAPIRPCAVVALAAAIALLPRLALAACNEPPDPSQAKTLGLWQSSIGGIDSPFLIPGKKIGGTDRTTAIRAAAIASDDVVSIAFLGGTTAPPVILVLASDCTGVPTCGGAAICEKETLTYEPTGPSTPVPSLSFTAKDFDVGGHVRAGKVRLAVTPKTEVPCWLLDPAKSCNQTPLPHACIDQLQSTGAAAPKMVTALPPPNDFSAICVAQPGTPPCGGNGKELWLALDSRGDLLIPMDWGKIVHQSASNNDCVEGPSAPICQKRNVAATTTVPATASGSAIQLPSSDRLQSLNADGETFNPGPTFAVDTAVTSALALYGTVDKAFSVLRILGCPPSNVDCSTRSFDLSPRREPGGPVVLRRKGNGKGYCEDSGLECPPPCNPAETGPCIGFDGQAKTLVLAMTPPEVPPPTPVPGPKWPWWLLALAAVGLVWLWVHNRNASLGSGGS